jgi:BirA family biotin operon repressor/biotin-[acetyl-CoA-carboxylase] ligase
MQLAPLAAAAGVRLVTYPVLASTNREALSLAQAGEQGPLWIVAQKQTAGRGRRKRAWISEPGNLYATLLLSGFGAAAATAQLSFVAALAAHDALVALAPAVRFRFALKWPNDVLCDGRKISGILLEGETDPSRTTVVAIGIGINCLHHPHATEFPATDLAAEGMPASAEAVFGKLSEVMVARLGQWDRGAGFATIREDWLARASGLGQSIRVRLPDRETIGLFEALDDQGRLIVRYPDGGFEYIAAGEVFPLFPVAAESV